MYGIADFEDSSEPRGISNMRDDLSEGWLEDGIVGRRDGWKAGSLIGGIVEKREG